MDFSYKRLLSKYLYFLLVYRIIGLLRLGVRDFIILLLFLLLLLPYKKYILTNTHVRVIQGGFLDDSTLQFIVIL